MGPWGALSEKHTRSILAINLFFFCFPDILFFQISLCCSIRALVYPDFGPVSTNEMIYGLDQT